MLADCAVVYPYASLRCAVLLYFGTLGCIVRTGAGCSAALLCLMCGLFASYPKSHAHSTAARAMASKTTQLPLWAEHTID
jgi:hypothetical protein